MSWAGEQMTAAVRQPQTALCSLHWEVPFQHIYCVALSLLCRDTNKTTAAAGPSHTLRWLCVIHFLFIIFIIYFYCHYFLFNYFLYVSAASAHMLSATQEYNITLTARYEGSSTST
jgi:hypothetical protein